MAARLERGRATRNAAALRHYRSRSLEQKRLKAEKKLARKHAARSRLWARYKVLGLFVWQTDPKPAKVRRAVVVLTDAERAMRRRLRNQRKWAKRKGAKGKITPADVQWLQSAQKGRCFYCCERFGKAGFHIDHFVALAAGGSNERENLRLACADCNIAKSDKPAAEFMGMLIL